MPEESQALVRGVMSDSHVSRLARVTHSIFALSSSHEFRPRASFVVQLGHELRGAGRGERRGREDGWSALTDAKSNSNDYPSQRAL